MRKFASLPRGLLACALVAVLNAAAWAVITPPFQVPDELVHVGYVQYLAETGRLPALGSETVPSEELGLAAGLVPFSTEGDPTWNPARSERAHDLLNRRLRRVEPRAAGYIATNPPLYYGLAALPYRASSSASLLDRLLVMRLFSALLTGLLVVFVFLFLREALPRWPLGWRVGALGVALHPMVGFVGGGVNPDILLWVLCAALFWLFARAFRSGLSLRSGAAVGLVTVAALLTKPAMLTVVPGVLLALAIVCAPRARRRRSLLAAGTAVATMLLPYALWGVISEAPFSRQTVADAPLTTVVSGHELGLRDGLSYLWQFYLPQLPFMTEQFPGYPSYPLWETYFKGFVGRFGWFQFTFPVWANQVALAVVVLVTSAAGAALLRARGAVIRRWPELAAYAAIALSTILFVHAAGYQYRQRTGFNFEQTRYLFPLLALYGGVLALAVGSVGRSWSRPVAVFLIMLLAAHDVFAQALTLGRYYL